MTRALTAAVFMVLAVSAALKFVDLAAFRHAIREWSTLPQWSQALLVPLVPVVEMSLAAWYLARWRTRLAVSATFGFVLCLTIGLAVEHFAGEATACGCFGRLAGILGLDQDMALAIGRNVLLLIVLAGWFFAASGDRAREQSRLRPRVASAGFTLVEVLVCLVIVGVLSTLVFAALGAAKQRSLRAGVSTRLQQHAAVMTMYATDHRDCLPYVTKPLPEPTVLSPASAAAPVRLLYFSAFFGWSVGLADGYYDGRYVGGPFRSPFWRQPEPGGYAGGWTDFFYPCAFLAAPAYWDFETRLAPPEQLTSSRISMVAFPSRKSLVVHDLPFTMHSPLAAAFVDGHARMIEPGMIRPEVNDDGNFGRRFGGHVGGGGPRLMHTFEGVKGVDLR